MCFWNFLAIDGEFSSDRLMSVQTMQWTLLKPLLLCTVLFERERDNYSFEDTVIVTGLEDVPEDNQYLGGGGYSEQCKE